MKQEPNVTAVFGVGSSEAPDLFRRTLRTMAVLVAACVVFVGGLSGAAVLIASKAVGASPPPSAEARDPSTSSKKPLSI